MKKLPSLIVIVKKILLIFYKYGFCLVTDVLNESERDNLSKLLYKDLVDAVNYHRIYEPSMYALIDDIRRGELSWPQASTSGTVKKGFLEGHGLPQGKFAWTLRTDEKWKQIYQCLHQCEDVVVGLDLPFFNPVEEE